MLHHGFYQALNEEGIGRIGDAVNYSKNLYHDAPYHRSELYSFILLGDPAMNMPSSAPQQQAPSFAVEVPTTQQTVTTPTTVSYELTIVNDGPVADSYEITVDSVWAAAVLAEQPIMLQPGESRTVTIEHTVDERLIAKATDTATLTVTSTTNPLFVVTASFENNAQHEPRHAANYHVLRPLDKPPVNVRSPAVLCGGAFR